MALRRIDIYALKRRIRSMFASMAEMNQAMHAFEGQPGPQGPAGPTGAPGATGAQGPQGVAGAKGDKGDAGNDGLPGSAGAAGAKGDKGDAGTAGSQIQSTRVQTDAAGLYTWTYPTPYASGVVPHVMAIVEGPNPAGGVLVNAQVEGVPTNTQAKIRVTKSQASLVSLLGLTILSIPASVGATFIHIEAKSP